MNHTNHTNWLKQKQRPKMPQQTYKPWVVFNYVHGRPYEVCQYSIRADAENHKRFLERFLSNPRVTVAFVPPEAPPTPPTVTPDPDWDYAPIWEKLDRIIFETRHLKKILAEQEKASDQGDAATSAWSSKLNKHLNFIGQCLGDIPNPLDQG
ncbi:hypothetical protein [Coleofasciculus sp.]|uniref:hypothetical protein n=1 Tax=Coleofasciculus sp. TaxID=3100458 RepID=UPI0039FB823C